MVENAFGILANRFRLFHTSINLNAEKVTTLVLSACCLHNYLVEKDKHSYLSACDSEDPVDNQVLHGMWRKDPNLAGIAPSSERNARWDAKIQRQALTDYFSSEEGAVSW